ncbi:MAG: sulfatase-like hydrolase/transferase [Caldilineaceae bacterium]
MAQRPNILFMIADDHRHSAIGAFGNPTVRTPVLDRLAAEGVSFSRTHILGGWNGAVCVTSRAALMTGVNPLASTASKDGPLAQTIPPHLALMPETFRQNGYRTFFSGKWHNDKATFARGWAQADTIFFGGMSDHDKVPLRPFDPSGAYPEEAVRTGEGFSTELFSDSVIRFLQEYRDDAPFFAYLAFTSPHDPRTPPPPYDKMYDPAAIPLPPNFLPEHPFDNGELRVRDELLAGFPRQPAEVQQHLADYYGMISHMDFHIGRILDALAESGHADNTIVVYVADHGIAIGQHGLFGKQNVYDHSIRVPLILRGPGLPAGQRVDALNYSFDLFPTLCELTGVAQPATVESQSLLPLIDGAAGRPSLFACYRDMQCMVTTDAWKLIRNTRVPNRRGEIVGTDRWQLFNLQDDPWETNDLVDKLEFRNEQQALEIQLANWRKRVGH